MRIAVLSDTPSDTRVAATPETVKKFATLGGTFVVQAGAGNEAGMPDSEFEAAGATIAHDAASTIRDADVILKIRRPEAGQLEGAKTGALVVSSMDPHGHESEIRGIADKGVAAFAMELMPRITRAQVMDILSSQANLAGYRAVIDASAEYGRAFPMMMTAAGTVPAARVFVMGAGVAGLQAIATARRLGAIVTATDVRPAAKEQVESLGAKFVAVEDDEFKQAETAGGYAKEMSAEYRKKQADLVAAHIAKQDIVVTTALIPGRPAPRLVTGEMLSAMKPGSVVVDLAVERGGNVEGARDGELTKTPNGVKVVGYSSVERLAATASSLFARNIYAFVETLVDKTSKSLAVNWDDELVKATLLTRDGQIVHSLFGAAVQPTASQPAVATATSA